MIRPQLRASAVVIRSTATSTPVQKIGTSCGTPSPRIRM